MASPTLTGQTATNLFHVLGLRGRRVPAVVQDEDVRAGQALAHLVEELLLLTEERPRSEEGLCRPRTCQPRALLPAQLGSRGAGRGGRGVTVCIRVDSELATSTNTSASRQNLSIQLSSSVVTSMPGLEVTGANYRQAHRPGPYSSCFAQTQGSQAKEEEVTDLREIGPGLIRRPIFFSFHTLLDCLKTWVLFHPCITFTKKMICNFTLR